MKRNFQFEKRKKDLDKKQKREEKLKKKLERRNQADDATGEAPTDASALEPGSSPEADPAAG